MQKDTVTVFVGEGWGGGEVPHIYSWKQNNMLWTHYRNCSLISKVKSRKQMFLIVNCYHLNLRNYWINVMTSFLTLQRCFYNSLAPALHMVKGEYLIRIIIFIKLVCEMSNQQCYDVLILILILIICYCQLFLILSCNYLVLINYHYTEVWRASLKWILGEPGYQAWIWEKCWPIY